MGRCVDDDEEVTTYYGSHFTTTRQPIVNPDCFKNPCLPPNPNLLIRRLFPA